MHGAVHQWGKTDVPGMEAATIKEIKGGVAPENSQAVAASQRSPWQCERDRGVRVVTEECDAVLGEEEAEIGSAMEGEMIEREFFSFLFQFKDKGTAEGEGAAGREGEREQGQGGGWGFRTEEEVCSGLCDDGLVAGGDRGAKTAAVGLAGERGRELIFMEVQIGDLKIMVMVVHDGVRSEEEIVAVPGEEESRCVSGCKGRAAASVCGMEGASRQWAEGQGRGRG